MSKTIQINPDLFQFAKKGRKRNKTEKADGSKEGENRIKVKSASKERGKSTKTIRRDLLKFIRKQQEKNFKHLIQNDQNIVDKGAGETDFQSDFDESLKYLMEVANRSDESSPKNRTFKNYETASPLSADIVDIGLPNVLQTTESNTFKGQTNLFRYDGTNEEPNPTVNAVSPIKLLPPPVYGCLKGGNLPTYRTYQNITQKMPPERVSSTINHTLSKESSFIDAVNGGGGAINDRNSTPMSIPVNSPQFISNILDSAKQKSKEKTAKVVQEIKAGVETQKAAKQMSNLRYLKQRKTIRRTYAVGKSRFQPKIGVLISNRTIRNHTDSKVQSLKQVPITEVRSFLVKRGFIKVGTAAPNDVLRKMYESVALICGEVENHNSENLLYNYFNEKS